MRAFIIEAKPGRFNVGVSGIIDGVPFYRERYLIRGPWCKSTAREKRDRLQREIDRGVNKPGVLSHA